jgi:hypothetical protein
VQQSAMAHQDSPSSQLVLPTYITKEPFTKNNIHNKREQMSLTYECNKLNLHNYKLKVQ